MSNATVTIPLDEWTAHQGELETARRKAAELETQLAAAKLLVGDDRTVKALNELARAQGVIVAFAVGNLSPETIRNWPIKELRKTIGLAPVLAAYNQVDREQCVEWEAFASECERWERERALRAGRCPICRGRGVIDDNNASSPCACPAGDTATFAITGRGIVTGAQLKSEREVEIARGAYEKPPVTQGDYGDHTLPEERR
jgi:hypothetical protein